MADKERRQQVQKRAQKIAGEFFAAHHPIEKMVTVAKVETNQKLTLLTVFVTVLPEPDTDKPKLLDDLVPQLRKTIGDEIRFRKVPEVRLEFDRKESARRHVEEILNQAE